MHAYCRRCRFTEAAKLAAAAHKPSGGPDQQSVTALLSCPPLLLACDAACLDFWDASAAAAQHAASSPPPATYYRHATAQHTASADSWWPRPQLAGGLGRGPPSQAVEEVVEFAQGVQQRWRQRLEDTTPHEDGTYDWAGRPVVVSCLCMCHRLC